MRKTLGGQGDVCPLSKKVCTYRTVKARKCIHIHTHISIIYIYIYLYLYLYIHTHTYTYIHRERGESRGLLGPGGSCGSVLERPASGSRVHGPLSTEHGAYETVKAILWPCLSTKSPANLSSCSLFARKRPTTGEMYHVACWGALHSS